MNKHEFIRQLGVIADTLKPLTESASPGALVWNGVEYARNNESKEADPQALAWWAILITMAALLEAQESPLSTRQTNYIRDTLFGGMGSLKDLSCDIKRLPPSAGRINRQLKEQLETLFRAFTTSGTDTAG
jgi:hypothetical protein